MAVVSTNDYFVINGIRCDTVGLTCDTPPIPAMAVQDYTEWTTGADSPKASPDGTYNNVSYTLTAYVLLSDSPHDNTDIYAYFAEARTLTISRLIGYYFKILKVNSIQPSVKYDGKSIKYTISLTLAPFRYHLDNSPVVLSGTSITNPGTRYSRPKYVISNRASGNTQLTLYVNGRNFVLKELTDSMGSITIDAEKMLVYDANNNSLISKSTGQIPFLAPDVNAISVSTGTLTITGNWRSF